jgi:GNAT superfamily N-acetyltransferase
LSELEFRLVPLEHPDVEALVARLQLLYVGWYGAPDVDGTDASKFVPPGGAFFVGYLDGVPIATGAWRLVDDTRSTAQRTAHKTAEIKRMFVVPEAQRGGHASAMLAHLEETAAAAGATTMILMTGAPQVNAIAFYGRRGYEPIPPFGHYVDHPNARAFSKSL